MFNYFKKKAEKDTQTPLTKQIPNQAQESGITYNDNTSTINFELQDHHRDTGDRVYTQMLDESRSGTFNRTLEGSLSQEDDNFHKKRNDKAYSMPSPPVNMLEEANDQKKYDAIRKARKNKKLDNEFWKQDVGKEVENKTQLTPQDHKSQLFNHPNRFEKTPETMPIEQSHQENSKRVEKENKIDEMLTDSLKQADAMLFHIYAQAESNRRDLTNDEDQMIKDINAAKGRIFAAKDGNIDYKTAGLNLNSDV